MFSSDRADLVHHRRAIDHLQPRQRLLDLRPVGDAERILLEADAGLAEPVLLEHGGEARVG